MTQTETRPNILHLMWSSIRPRHWIKSSFLIVPALFTLQILDPHSWIRLLAGVLGFSLIASSIYLINDIINRSEDRLHPLKKHRPIASGLLSVGPASVFSMICFVSGTILLGLANISAVQYGLGYFGLMIVYTVFLRSLYIIDVITIAIGFVLRIMAGANLIDEPVSYWLILCTFTIAVFLGLIKRRQEIAAMTDTKPKPTRKVLSDYPSLSIVDGWINVLAGMTVLCYALYTVDPQTIEKHHTGRLVYTLPFVLYGIFHYQSIALSGRQGEDPVQLISSDTRLRIVVAIWGVTVAGILYFAKM
ncbi:MAG: UbiA prenyltransferase family protein [Calditrichaeota bacterium]|nr:UbiA prenyltransferase family protein [Calditrichota bacterium]MBT7616014.1 UbiA prenyltransferase family protein [Calditrichota bacterium]MBT7788927.1 UbiA prenyltransferase family protein [Calditrichota bacterium]